MPEAVDIGAAAEALLTTAVEATPAWIRRCVEQVLVRQQIDLPDDAIDDAITRGVRFVETRMGELLRADIDEQRSTPLSVFRDAVRFPVEVLHTVGAVPIERRDVARWAFPSDPFGLTPGNLSDIGDEVSSAGIIWGATKAAVHLQRRRT